MDIQDIHTIFYYPKDNTCKIRKIALVQNRITSNHLLRLCRGVDHVTVLLYTGRRVNLGIRNAKRLFNNGHIYF